jgi:hypothetical protein
VRTPRFVRIFSGVLRRLNQILTGIVIVLLVAIAGLLLYLTYGTTFSRAFATDGSPYSCEIQFLPKDSR